MIKCLLYFFSVTKMFIKFLCFYELYHIAYGHSSQPMGRDPKLGHLQILSHHFFVFVIIYKG